MKTVAIVGTHPNTRDKAPYTNPDVDIWVFNNQIIQGWVPRADAVFDIHPPQDIYRRCAEHDVFDKWLRADKAQKFYTPYPIEDAPGNVVYPLEDIAAALLPNFKRGDEPNKYFTSGPCYALALSVYLGYERIEFYGIEMEANSEYIYQRDGIGLWFGIALGRGIEVYIPKESMLFYAPLYGYDLNAATVDREAFEVRASELAQAMEKTESQLNAAKGALDSVLARINLMQQQGKPAHQIQKLGEEYEIRQHEYEQAIANHAFINGQFLDCKAWQTRVEKALEYSGNAQAVLAQNSEKYSRMIDRMTLNGEMGIPQ